jgi:DNA-binding NarL/FixJ family response regulator
MPTILVIDDDPYTEMLVAAAVPPAWTVLWAPNGLAGVDMLRQRQAERREIDLVVLDIVMPAFDGYDTCLRIRQLAPTVAILPFTSVQLEANASLAAYMRELACAPPLQKGCRVEMLAQRIRDALALELVAPPSTGFLARLQQKALETETQARQANAARVALFAADPVIRFGLRALLSSMTVVIRGEASTEQALRELLAGTRTHALVAAGQDRAVALAVAREYGVALILVVPTRSDAHALVRVDGVAGVVVSTDLSAPSQLVTLIEALAAGGYHSSAGRPTTPAGNLLLEDRDTNRGAGLTERERTLLALDGPGVSPETLAQLLNVSKQTILQYQSRIRRKLAEAASQAGSQERFDTSGVEYARSALVRGIRITEIATDRMKM